MAEALRRVLLSGIRVGEYADEARFGFARSQIVLASLPGARASLRAMAITGKKIVLTGSFSKVTRKDAHIRLEAMGADVTSGVSSKTHMLFSGKRAGSKLAQAKAAGIPVYDEAELLKVLETGEAPGDPVVVSPALVGEEILVMSPMPSFPCYPDDGPYEEKNEEGVVELRGQFSDSRRTGEWTWFHESGARQCVGSYIEGKQQGPETQWYETGEPECSGEYLDDERHGYWEWTFESGEKKGHYTYAHGKKHGDFEWRYTPAQRASNGQFRNDKYFGDWSWWREDGGLDTKRSHDEEGRKHGREETTYSDGTPKVRANYEHGFRTGLCETFYEDGKPEQSAHYVNDEFHGTVDTWDEGGKKTSAEYVNGLPAKLDKKNLASIGKRIRKKEDSYDKMGCLDELLEDVGTKAALLARLHAEGHLNLSDEPLLWDELDADTLTGTELVSILSGIESYDVGEDNCINMFGPFWTEALDELSVKVYARDPEPLDAAWEQFPGAVKRGFSLVLLRFGKIEAAALEGDVLGDLAKYHVKEHGLPHSIWIDSSGVPVEVALYGDLQQPNDKFYEFIESIGTREKWDRAVLKQAQRTGGNYGQVLDAIGCASIKQLIKLFDKIGIGVPVVYDCLLDLRDDSPKALLELAEGLDSDHAEEAVIICAVLRMAAAGEEVPADLDAKIGFRGYNASVGKPLFPGLTQTLDALRAMGAERANAIIERELQGEYFKTYPIPALSVFNDDALRKRAYGVIEEDAKKEHYNMRFVSHALAVWGKEALPIFAAQYAAAGPKPLRDTYRRAIVIVLSDLAEAGADWPEEFDTHIDFYDWGRGIDDHTYEHYIAHFLSEAIASLPIERARNVMLRSLVPEEKKFGRALACLPDVKDTQVWQQGFRLLHGNAEQIKSHTKYLFINAWRDTGDETDEWVRWCVENDPSPKLMALLKDFDYNLDEKIAKWAEEAGANVKPRVTLHGVDELVADIMAYSGPEDRERIYLLKKLEKRQDDSLNQIGGCPLGITAATWPMYEDEPMEHLFTLDLDTMPECRGPDSKTRTVSVFINNAGSNQAWEPANDKTALISLVDDDLAEGRLESAPGKEIELEYFVPMAAEVPVDIFDEEPPQDPALRELRDAVYGASARVLGSPLWLQDAEHWGFLLMQFDEGFVDINLGDAGVMYLFSDAQFWQCH